MENHVDRKHPPHFVPLKSHNQVVIVFVTVCTWSRRSLLASPEAHEHLHNVWESAPAWFVGRYVLMPNHLHFFCAPGSWPAASLEDWVRFWKSRTAATWPGPRIGRIWQRDFWDTQLRAGENYDTKWEYIRHNPVRAGLVNDPDDWPYQGELHVLRWHD
jgi:REP element-mobilizing transposase RayT